MNLPPCFKDALFQAIMDTPPWYYRFFYGRLGHNAIDKIISFSEYTLFTRRQQGAAVEFLSYQGLLLFQI